MCKIDFFAKVESICLYSILVSMPGEVKDPTQGVNV